MLLHQIKSNITPKCRYRALLLYYYNKVKHYSKVSLLCIVVVLLQ